MLINVKKIIFTIFISSLFIGCLSKPLTKNIINDIGIDEINRFQYYLSSNIVLTAVERVKEQNIDKKGTANIKESSYRDKIIIGKSTMGVLMNSMTDDNGLLILDICFEEKTADSDKTLTFKQDGLGGEQIFYIVYKDPKKRLLDYGDKEYTVEVKSGGRVYLEIKINKSDIEKERVRRVKGRKVEN